MDFYKHISKRKGKYNIIKDGVWYGTYDDVRVALHDRDLLVDSNWDLTEMLARNETENKYLKMNLPPFDYRKYITMQKKNGKKYYVIRKVINGNQKWFGGYKTLKEAMSRRDELMRCNWEI